MAHTLDPVAAENAVTELADQWRKEADGYETFADSVRDQVLASEYRRLAKDLRGRVARLLADPVRAAMDLAEAAKIRKSAAASTDLQTRRELSAVADQIERGEAR